MGRYGHDGRWERCVSMSCWPGEYAKRGERGTTYYDSSRSNAGPIRCKEPCISRYFRQFGHGQLNRVKDTALSEPLQVAAIH